MLLRRPFHSTHVLAAAATLLAAACAPAPRSSRLTTSDFEEMAVELSAKLRSSPFLSDRGPDSPPLIVAVSKVENLSSDLLSEGERWYLIDRIMDAQTMTDLSKNENIRFVIPAEKLALLRERLRAEGDEPGVGAARAPTHTMTARIRSLTRAAGADRTDLYDCQCTILSLADGELVWTDSFAIKRIAVGKAYN